MSEFERITSIDVLTRAWQKISAKKDCFGIDGVDLSLYRADLRKNIRALQTAVANGAYRPYSEKIYTSGNRHISIHCVDDKIIQTAVAGEVAGSYLPSKCAHGFIKNRSIFTAKKSLDCALKSGTADFIKTDISRFYDSIDNDILFAKLKAILIDARFLSLVELLIYSHSPGVSTGSCLSPVLSNLYLADFDNKIENNSVFFARYVDDMLVSPCENLRLITDKLYDVGLEINPKKSEAVNAIEGFTFLGFDIKTTIDTALTNGDFALAEELYTAQKSDIAAEPQPESPKEEPGHEEAAKPEYELPNHIRNVVRKCRVVKEIAEKAKTQKHIDFAEKSHLLQIFHCLGDEGAKFIHHILSLCEEYDYAETQRRIKKYKAPNPIGCKKLCDRVGNAEQCICNFTKDKLYPTPIIHAMRVTPDCFKPSAPQDNIGHFKGKTPEHKAEDALTGLLELNKKAYEIREQQNIFKGQIESLFERNNLTEFQTPQGLLVKTNDGLFIKVG
jgi:retron-type reverse transcriptase